MAFVCSRAGVTAARLCIVVALLVAAACGGAPKRPPSGALEPDKFLFENGTKALDDRRWLVAREYFRQLVDSYPQSPYRADAKLGIADTYLGERTPESTVLAVNEYREFLSFYPTHERAHYAQFKLGMTHFYQMKGPERDQTETKEAIAELTTYLQRYADKPLAGEARQRLREARDRLSMSEYRVGVFYFRQRWYPGALDRLTALIEERPGIHVSRRHLLLPRADLLESRASGRSASLPGQAGEGVREERVPRGGAETDRADQERHSERSQETGVIWLKVRR